MNNFEERMKRINEAAVAQTKSVNIDVRAYRGVWVAGVGGVQVCISNSFLEVVQAIEDALGLRTRTRFSDLIDLAKQWGFTGAQLGVAKDGHFLAFKGDASLLVEGDVGYTPLRKDCEFTGYHSEDALYDAASGWLNQLIQFTTAARNETPA